MTAPAPFKQSDVTRLLKGAMKAGCREEALVLTAQPDGSLSLTNPRAGDQAQPKETERG